MKGVLGWALASAAFATSVVGTTAVGCFDYTSDCALINTCLDGISSGTSGGGGETPAACVPSDNGEPVAAECGVFVSSSHGSDSAGASKDAPAKTLKAALAAIEEQRRPKRIYACAEVFAEAVELPAGVAIYGGLDCDKAWAWVGATKKTILAAGPDLVALTLRGGGGTTRIEDVSVKAADAQTAGASSIAVLVDGATAELTRSEMVAGHGADGAPGVAGAAPAAPGDPVPAAQGGTPGNDGADACGNIDGTAGPDPVLAGGSAAENACDGDASVGGRGGDGAIASGADGEAGVTGAFGAAGTGEPSAGVWSCVATGTGQGGADGTPGTAGPGASGLGTLSSSAGYVGVSGSPGTSGKAGQGGGGGGGAKGLSNCGGGMPGAGASGGSGGAGGCGGKPGQGGGAGGASIALASVNATVTLTDCRLTAGEGGKGGVGGQPQSGGAGGRGGAGGTGGLAQDACDGGKGGKGGGGGPGGGGLGGPSFALAFQGTPVVKDAKTQLTPGTAGEGGPGGNDNAAMNVGANGTIAEEQEIP
jgi:hypothetical protein